MRLVVIIGPPAVGKATVGKALSEGYGFKLFHNHVTLDMVASVFDWGSAVHGRLVEEFRVRMIEEAAAANIDLVFTYVWAFSEPDDGSPLRHYREIVLRHGGSIYFVELTASASVRAVRNGLPSRRAMKQRSDESSAPEWIAQMDSRFTFDSGGRLPFDDPQVRIDTTETAPEVAARMITEAFGFERVESLT
jgi:hypothetical protein